MPTRREALLGATAVVAGGLLLPAVATTAAAAPPSDADRQAADRAFDRERQDRQSLPDDLTSYGYGGSLTTEPFAEGVRWQVLRRAVQIENDTVNRFQQLFPLGNARATQPLNGRVVRLFPGRLG